ncbi:oligopeptidase B [Amycolatopsis xylanica]|uniref:Oligopeptidase B n=1 Tax=Amycolatopsis xylanica TaxID=589385 RepID=A0A1H3T9F3_9PSEU|nr:oligopeptidase B [Amycolatopsis xylanica]
MIVKSPVAKRTAWKRLWHDDLVVDPYHWLADADSEEVSAYLLAENRYAEERTAEQERLRSEVLREIGDRSVETDLSVPVRVGDWWYYSRIGEGEQLPVHCRADGPVPARAGERVILDENELADGHDYLAVGVFDVSPCGNRLAYSADHTGNERFTLRIRDLATGTDLPDEIPGTFYGSAWSLDGSVLYYVRADETWRAHQVLRHVIGTSPDLDTVVFEERDDRFHVGVGLTRGRRFVEIVAESRTTSEAWLIDAADPAGEPRVVVPRRQGVQYGVEHWADPEDRARDVLLVLHNSDGKRNFELATAEMDRPHVWTPLLPHREEVRLESVDVFAGHFVLAYRRDGLTGLAVHAIEDGRPSGTGRELGTGEVLRTLEAERNPEYHATAFRFTGTSLITPDALFEYETATGETRLLKRQEVPGFDRDDYEQRRVWATAEDGTRVPVSVAFRRGLERDGASPCLLYGYGAYGTSLDPAFSVARLSLLDRGFVFAIAHVRGGGELGSQWHERGKLMSKMDSFTDFIACARHLAAGGWTSADRLVIRGDSVGGLLVSAVANLAPEAIRGVVADVPFTDVLTTMLDPGLPLTATEREEWGDPVASAEAYAYLKAYSPYENVSAQSYPDILATANLMDARVGCHEAAKWIARLRATATSGEFLLRTELTGGHTGSGGRYDEWLGEAFRIAWIIRTATSAQVGDETVDHGAGDVRHRDELGERAGRGEPPAAAQMLGRPFEDHGH